MDGAFDEELREQLVRAHSALARAEAEQDDDGIQAYAGRVAGLREIAQRYGVELSAADDPREG